LRELHLGISTSPYLKNAGVEQGDDSTINATGECAYNNQNMIFFIINTTLVLTGITLLLAESSSSTGDRPPSRAQGSHDNDTPANRAWAQQFMVAAWAKIIWICGIVKDSFSSSWILQFLLRSIVKIFLALLMIVVLAWMLGVLSSAGLTFLHTRLMPALYSIPLLPTMLTRCDIPPVRLNNSHVYSDEFIKMTWGVNSTVTTEMASLAWLASDLALVHWHCMWISSEFRYAPFDKKTRGCLSEKVERYGESADDASICLKEVNYDLDIVLRQCDIVFENVVNQIYWRHVYYGLYWIRGRGSSTEANAWVIAKFHGPLKLLNVRIQEVIPVAERCKIRLDVATRNGRQLFDSLQKTRTEVRQSRDSWNFFRRPNQETSQNQDLLLFKAITVAKLGVSTLTILIDQMLEIHFAIAKMDKLHQLRDEYRMDYEIITTTIAPRLQELQKVLRKRLDGEGEGPPDFQIRLHSAHADSDRLATVTRTTQAVKT
jgi:hypothetical protein